jgi:hypothetical protein
VNNDRGVQEECGGRLKKEGVRFGGTVPEGPLNIAIDESKKADVALVLGSSMSGARPLLCLSPNPPSLFIFSSLAAFYS